MNLIKILVKLLDKAYHAEVRKHHKAANKHAAESERHYQAAQDLRDRATAAANTADYHAINSVKSGQRAADVQAKAAQVSQFFTV